jgi:hypothetical protein
MKEERNWYRHEHHQPRCSTISWLTTATIKRMIERMHPLTFNKKYSGKAATNDPKLSNS